MKEIKKSVIISLISILSIFTVSELFLRVVLHQKLKKRHYPNVYMPDSIVGYKYIPNSQDQYSSPAFTYEMKINSKGHYDSELGFDEKGDSLRIIFVGASDDIGPDSYVRLLRDRFKELYCKVQVINASVDGEFREFERLKYIKQEITKYKPDLIFITGSIPLYSNLVYRSHYKDFLLVYSDWNSLPELKKYVEETHCKLTIFRLLFDYSYSFRYFCKYYCENDNEFAKTMKSIPLLKNKTRVCEYLQQTVRVGEFSKLKKLSIKESHTILNNMSVYLKSNNISLVYSEKMKYDSKLKEFIQSTGNKYIGNVLKTDKNLEHGKNDGHTSVLGHEIIVEKYFNTLINSELIPSYYLNDSLRKIILQKDKIPNL